MHTQPEKTFACPVCGTRYADAATALECEAWCRAHGSCNLDIIARAVDADIA